MKEAMENLLAGIPKERPVLIAGPTASGKSGLALRLVEEAGGVVLPNDDELVKGIRLTRDGKVVHERLPG